MIAWAKVACLFFFFFFFLFGTRPTECKIPKQKKTLCHRERRTILSFLLSSLVVFNFLHLFFLLFSSVDPSCASSSSPPFIFSWSWMWDQKENAHVVKDHLVSSDSTLHQSEGTRRQICDGRGKGETPGTPVFIVVFRLLIVLVTCRYRWRNGRFISHTFIDLEFVNERS